MAKRNRLISYLNKDTIDALAALITKGMPKNRACDAIGMHRTTLHKWLVEADEIGDREPKNAHERMILYASKTIKGARSKLLERIVLNVQVKGADDWRAWAWMGERMFPADLCEHKTLDANVTNAPMLDALTKAANMVTDQDGDS